MDNKEKDPHLLPIVNWFSVKDEFPDDCTGVLVCGKGYHGRQVIQIAFMPCGEEKKWKFISNTDVEGINAPWSDVPNDWLELKDIEYWAHLPQTPEQMLIFNKIKKLNDDK
jgi:hypothetical protein